MYRTACYLVDIAQMFPKSSNIISYLRQCEPTLIWPTKCLYLLFLWSLLAAYIQALSQSSLALIPNLTLAQLGYAFLLIVFLTRSGNLRAHINQILVFLMFLTLASFLLFLPSKTASFFIDQKLSVSTLPHGVVGIMLMSFGFHHIVPSLCALEKEDSTLKRTIALSISIIVCVYLLWVGLILNYCTQYDLRMVQPLDFLKLTTGDSRLDFLPILIGSFSYLAGATSSVGVAIGVMDFLDDIFKSRSNLSKNSAVKTHYIAMMTVLPCLIVNLLAPWSFLKILSLASYFSLYILIILPCWIHFKVTNHKSSLLTGLIATFLILFI